MSKQFARGIIQFDYDIEEFLRASEWPEEDWPTSIEDLRGFFADRMLSDIIDIAWSDLLPCIEMEIVDEYGEVINEVSEVQA